MNEQMEIEWEAWQAVCKSFRARGIEPNDKANESLFCLIRIWGEQLAKLRFDQPPHYGDKQIEMDIAKLNRLSS